ncbi:hypothetical protein HanIR_Chr06g0284321 [Helianthus annuus]|nr:hypothetical protein HanIR_Chr06g0284321 [Helianthus annuus]
MLKDDYFRIYIFLCFNFLKSLNPLNAQTHAPMFPLCRRTWCSNFLINQLTRGFK